MSKSKKEFLSYLENLGIFVLCFFLVALPVLFLSTTTDAFVLPKQLLLISAATLSILLLGIKTIVEGKLRFKSSPFDIPILLFLAISFFSAVFSANHYDSYTFFVPILFAVLLYFVIVGLVKGEKQLLLILASLTLGGVASSAITILSFFKIYPLPFPYTHVQYFTTFGSLLDQAIYLAVVLPISGYFAYSFFSSLKTSRETRASGYKTLFTASFLIILASLGITVYMLATTQKPLILPFEVGLQTSFASISQDSLNVIKSFLVGSGIGTYMTDFSRFKPVSYNLNNDLWTFTFFRSSSFFLELLATTGLLGVGAFLLLVYRVVKEKEFFLPIILVIVAAFLLPFSFTLTALLFIVLAVFAVGRIHANPDKYGEVDFYLVALKRGLLVASPDGERPHQSQAEKKFEKILPLLACIVLFAVTLVPFYFVLRFAISDFVFQKSLVSASQNKALETYNQQVAAINMFPYRDVYYLSFSQTNLALANALATNQGQNKDKPDAQIQQQILTLIQQSINSGRNATTMAPLTSRNWNNLSSIYRALIGFGENADKFAVLTLQQAISLDPNNPQQYIDLGGVYYQLGQYDEAARQFQIAINMKKDYANAYYNLGHALEQKEDFQGALNAYQIVRQLSAANPENVKKVDADIAVLQEKAKAKEAQPVASGGSEVKPQAGQTPLDVNKPGTTLPERDPRVKIPAPTVSPAPSKAEAQPTPSL